MKSSTLTPTFLYANSHTCKSSKITFLNLKVEQLYTIHSNSCSNVTCFCYIAEVVESLPSLPSTKVNFHFFCDNLWSLFSLGHLTVLNFPASTLSIYEIYEVILNSCKISNYIKNIYYKMRQMSALYGT